jgi:hypothetical protein
VLGKLDVEITWKQYTDSVQLLGSRWGIHNPTDALGAAAILAGDNADRRLRLVKLFDLSRPRSAGEIQELTALAIDPLSRYFSDDQVLARVRSEFPARPPTAHEITKVASKMIEQRSAS